MPRGPAQVLAAGHRQEVAADLAHVDRQLADRLAGVEQVEHAGIVGDLADRLGRLHQPALRRHMGDRDQLGALVDGALQGAKVDLAVVVVGHHDDLRAGLLGDLQVGDVVRRIFADAGQDAVARLEVEGVEGEVPGPRGVLDEGDLRRPRRRSAWPPRDRSPPARRAPWRRPRSRRSRPRASGGSAWRRGCAGWAGRSRRR